MDTIFEPKHFLNEIVWARTNAHNITTRLWPRQHDILLMYARSENFTVNPVYQPYVAAQLRRYRPDENGRLYIRRHEFHGDWNYTISPQPPVRSDRS